jgi:hypothetical protein
MKKLLFFCTHANQGTGYAKSAAKVVNTLADRFDITYYAFQNYPGQAIEDRYIDSRIKFVDAIKLDAESPKGFGDKGIIPTFDDVDPHIIFIYNDLPVCVSIIELLGKERIDKCKLVTYLDIVYPWQDIRRFEKLRAIVDLCYVYTNAWKDHMVNDLGWPADVIDVIHLGVDDTRLDISQEDALVKLGLDKSDYLVVNMNRNSYRKQWCTTIRAWFKFWIDNGMDPRIKLFVGGMIKTDDGYDILELIDIECMRYGIDNSVKNTNILINPKPLTASDEYINLVYAAGAVGINTCCGEGYGLTNVEHALYGKPQVVSGVPAVKEVLGQIAVVIEPIVWTTVSKFESHGGEIAIHDYKMYADALTNLYRQGFSKASTYIDFIKKTCNWDTNLRPLDRT